MPAFDDDEPEFEDSTAYCACITLFQARSYLTEGFSYANADPAQLRRDANVEREGWAAVKGAYGNFWEAIRAIYTTHGGRKAWRTNPETKANIMPPDYKTVIGNPSEVCIVEELFATSNRMRALLHPRLPGNREETQALLQSAQALVDAFEMVLSEERSSLESLPPLPTIVRPSMVRRHSKTGKRILSVISMNSSKRHR